MNLVTFLLMGYLAFGADRDRLPLSDQEKGPVETLTDLALLAKGRILVCFVKEGMTAQQVVRILGHPNVCWGNFGGSSDDWLEYGIRVDFTIVDRAKYDSRVTGVRWRFPPDFRWNRLWSFGSASHQENQKRYSPTSFPSPEQRMHELINNSEDLPKIEEEWDKFWKEPKSKAERVHGGIQ